MEGPGLELQVMWEGFHCVRYVGKLIGFHVTVLIFLVSLRLLVGENSTNLASQQGKRTMKSVFEGVVKN